MVKYSFSPPAGALFLIRRRKLFLSMAAAVSAVALLGAWLFLKTPIGQLAIEPFRVSSLPNAVSPGFADLMTLTERVFSARLSVSEARNLAYGLGIVGSVGYAFFISRFRIPPAAELTLISIASLFFVKHLVYDYVFLVVVLCYAITARSVRIRRVLGGAVLIFWFLLPLITRRLHAANQDSLGLLVNFACLAALFTGTTYVIIVRNALSEADCPIPKCEFAAPIGTVG